MSLGRRKHKSEHAGAKNGGGHWGPREEAKQISKKLKRTGYKAIIRSESLQPVPTRKKSMAPGVILGTVLNRWTASYRKEFGE